MKKRLLTLEDLYNYYSSTSESSHFSAKENDETIVVQVDGNIRFEKDNDATDGLTPVILQSCHTLKNLNGSNISEESMQAALPSFSNRPILGYIHEVNGQLEFYNHTMHQNDDGEIVYDEVPIGIIPESCNAHLEYDKDKKHNYVVVNGYIFDDYSKASEILERETECSVSVELSIRELSYNAKEKYLDIEDFFFSGVTILGKNPDGSEVKPGMEGSNIKLADFSRENNSIINYSEEVNNKLIETLDTLNNTLSKFNINTAKIAEENTKEGGNQVDNKNEVFEEVTETMEETVEEVTEESTEEVTVTEEMSEESTEETPEVVEEEIEDIVESETEEVEVAEETSEEVEVEMEVTEVFNERYQKIFEISHEDIRYALYNLLAPFEEADNEWYFITGVYDSYFAYENWNGGTIYGQNYTKDNDNVAFDGERYKLHKELLTDSEYAELQSMRSNYASISEELSKYQTAQLHTQREAILYNEKYSVLSEKDEEGKYKNEAYAKLVSEMDNYSLTDLEKELKSVFADYITNGGQFTYAGESEKPAVSKKLFATTSKKKTSRYGNLFNNK